jgi:hypothetical protein
MYPTNKDLHNRFEKARKKMKSDRGYRGKVKKFIVDALSRNELKEV